ncbi:SPOR domain-containing protein, partial [Granulosicoccus sp.]|nr:SPOR domain-containing protein [Granulosicoccus sp.]
RDKAQATWARLSGDMQTLQGKTARFMPFQSMTRLLVGPGKTRDAANSLCEELKTDNLDCLVRQIE